MTDPNRDNAVRNALCEAMTSALRLEGATGENGCPAEGLQPFVRRVSAQLQRQIVDVEHALDCGASRHADINVVGENFLRALQVEVMTLAYENGTEMAERRADGIGEVRRGHVREAMKRVRADLEAFRTDRGGRASADEAAQVAVGAFERSYSGFERDFAAYGSSENRHLAAKRSMDPVVAAFDRTDRRRGEIHSVAVREGCDPDFDPELEAMFRACVQTLEDDRDTLNRLREATSGEDRLFFDEGLRHALDAARTACRHHIEIARAAASELTSAPEAPEAASLRRAERERDEAAEIAAMARAFWGQVRELELHGKAVPSYDGLMGRQRRVLLSQMKAVRNAFDAVRSRDSAVRGETDGSDVVCPDCDAAGRCTYVCGSDPAASGGETGLVVSRERMREWIEAEPDDCEIEAGTAIGTGTYPSAGPSSPTSAKVGKSNYSMKPSRGRLEGAPLKEALRDLLAHEFARKRAFGKAQELDVWEVLPVAGLKFPDTYSSDIRLEIWNLIEEGELRLNSERRVTPGADKSEAAR